MSLLGGLLLGLASPPAVLPGAEFLGILGLVLLLEASLEERRPWLGAWLGGLVYYTWIAWYLRHTPAPLAVLGVPPAGACYFLLIAALLRVWERRLGRGSLPLGLALVWASYEWWKGHIFGIPYPHAQLAHALYAWPLLLGPVRLVGEAGMNALLALVAGGLWSVWRLRARGARSGLGLALGMLLWILLCWPLPALGSNGPPLAVALVQPCRQTYRDQGPPYVAYRDMEYLAYCRSLSLGAASPGAPVDLTVWPEGAFRAPVRRGKEEALSSFVQYLGTGSAHLIGAGLVEGEERFAPAWNTGLLFSKEGKLLGMAEKRDLVPLGEELPFVRWFLSRESLRRLNRWLSEATGGLARFVERGRDHPLPRLSDGRQVGIAICFENAFPERFAAQAREGASFFCVISHEGWYRGGSELDQMLAMTVFRALETGRAVLRSTTDGLTSWVGPDGRIRGRLPVAEPGVLRAELQPVRGSRPAMGLGFWLPYLLPAAYLVALLSARARRGV
ncbi:MAG: apolipoprotein N-acyltransferase [Planctomycetota bacterium]